MGLLEDTRTNLIAIADAYGAATGLARASVSRKFHGNQAFLGEFAAGRCSVTLDKLDEMVGRFRVEWPYGARWPAVAPVRMGRRG